MMKVKIELTIPMLATVHFDFSAGDFVGALDMGFFIAEADGGSEEEDVHQEVELGDDGGEDPEGAAHGRHEDEDEGEGRHKDRLGDEEALWHSFPLTARK